MMMEEKKYTSSFVVVAFLSLFSLNGIILRGKIFEKILLAFQISLLSLEKILIIIITWIYITREKLKSGDKISYSYRWNFFAIISNAVVRKRIGFHSSSTRVILLSMLNSFRLHFLKIIYLLYLFKSIFSN